MSSDEEPIIYCGGCGLVHPTFCYSTAELELLEKGAGFPSCNVCHGQLHISAEAELNRLTRKGLEDGCHD